MDIEQTVAVAASANEHPLRNASYRRWLVGNGISLLGDQFYLVALPWLVLEKLGSAAMLGTLMMVGAIPRAALLLVGGVATDRLSARWIMLVTAVVRTLSVAVTGALVSHGYLRAGEMYLLVAIFGIADAFAMPAQSAYLPAILHKEQLVAGSGLSQGVAQLASILGPIPAGLLIARLGVGPAFYIDAVSFLVVIAALLRLPDPPRKPSQAHPVKAIGEGIMYVTRDVPLRIMMILGMMVNLCVAGPLAVGIAYLVKLHAGSSTVYGMLVSAAAAGGLAGALLAGVWRVRRRGNAMLGGMALLGTCLSCISLFSARFYTLAIVLALTGCIAGFINIHVGAWVMQRIDAAVRGRVSSVLILVSLGAMPISMGIAGLVVARSPSIMFIVAGMLLLGVTAIAARNVSIRQIA